MFLHGGCVYEDFCQGVQRSTNMVDNSWLPVGTYDGTVSDVSLGGKILVIP